MSLRFAETTPAVPALLRALIPDHFPSLEKARIKVLFDLRMRKKGGGLILGGIRKPNELLRYFTRSQSAAIDGFDYIITLDKIAWGAATEADKTRLLRHELRHTYYDSDAKDPWRLLHHDIQDFASEIELNADDARWAEKLAVRVRTLYKEQSPTQGVIDLKKKAAGDE